MEGVGDIANRKTLGKTNRQSRVLPLVLAAVLGVFCITPVTVSAEGKAGAGAAGTAVSGQHVMVAVIDSGIDEDNSLIDYSKLYQAKSYVNGERSCDDKIGHGTAVVGIIQGYAPDAFITPLMYYTTYVSGVPRIGGVSAICKAIYDAVDNYKCKIINISSGITYESDELKAAIDYAESKGVIVISAVGNDNKIAADRVFYPAAYDTVIGVGAIDIEKVVAGFSQRNKSVTTVAYGVDIKVPGIKNGDRYATVSGTSYAAAALCGIAADIVEDYPDISPAQFRSLIKSSCRDLGEPGYDNDYGFGVPDIEALKVNLRLLTN